MKIVTSPRYLSLVAALILFVVNPSLYAQYTQLHNFDCVVDGCNPDMPDLLAQGQDGNLYTTMPTQVFGEGTVVESSLTGVFTTLFNFNGDDGFAPNSGLTLGGDGNFYGTTTNGGPLRKGTVFKLSGGVMTVLYAFTDGDDGAFPWAPPVQAPDGNIYGVTFNGTNQGRVYKITPAGVFSRIAVAPSSTQAPLVLASDGNLYGTTQHGGDFNQGTVFQLTTKGKLKVIHSFNPSVDGGNPGGRVLQGADGKLYGLTVWGGTFGQGIAYVMSTSGGGYKVLHNFQTSEGANSPAGLLQGSDGLLYGVMQAGGLNGLGTLFNLSTNGKKFNVLYNFDKGNGGGPAATPTLHTNGIIYGLTITGGTPSSSHGVEYSFNAGLKPFASLVVFTSGRVGDTVGILGQGFSTATGVKFGSGSGTLSVVSDTYMIASPAVGSTTGNVTVLEPSGNLVTPQVFKVTPAISGFSPASGPVGTQVTITGKSLLQTTNVTIGKKAAVFVVNSDTQVTATVAAGAVTGKVTLKTPGGTATAAGNFTVQ